MAPAAEETLAAGLWRDGRQHRRAVLRRLDAEARAELLDAAAAALPAERVTALLERTVVAIGELTQIGAADVRALPVGDRDRLVLALRRLAHGDTLRCVFGCRCGEALELELELGALLGGDAEPSAAPQHASALAAEGLEVRVRAATGADHEHAARLALTDPAAAARELLQACVVEARDPGGAAAAIEGAVADRAEALLAELDPAAELLLAGTCPGCGELVTASFDPISHLWAELAERQALLEYEVHILALHYHWGEREIVGMAPARRARYIEQLDRELSLR